MKTTADLFREMKACADKMDGASGAEIEQLSREFQALDADYRRAEANERLSTPQFGRDGGSVDDGPRNPTFFGGSDSIDLALSGWVRNAHGLPVPRAEFDAASKLNIDPRGGAFEIRLPTGAPTMGLRFAPRNLSSQSGPLGGYTTPMGFMARLESAMRDASGMMQTSEVWVTSDGRETPWPTCDDTSNTGYQLGEAQTVADSDIAFGATLFRAYKFSSGLIKAPHELVRDSAISIVDAVASKLGERLGRILNTRCTVGNGAGTISGVVGAATVGKTCASSSAITLDELVELQHSVDPAYRVGPGVGWMMNDSTASHLRRLKDGNGQPLWSDSMQEGVPSRLLGYPVTFNSDMPSIATGEKVVLFGKLSAYKIRIVSGIRFRQLNERFADSDQVGFLSFLEADGHLLNASANAALCPVRALAMA